MTAWICRSFLCLRKAVPLSLVQPLLSAQGPADRQAAVHPMGLPRLPAVGEGRMASAPSRPRGPQRSSVLLGGPRAWGRNQLLPPSRLESKAVEATVPHALLHFTGRRLLGRTPLQKHKFSLVRTGTGAGGRPRGLC